MYRLCLDPLSQAVPDLPLDLTGLSLGPQHLGGLADSAFSKIINGTGRAVKAIIESVTCRKILGIKVLEDAPNRLGGLRPSSQEEKTDMTCMVDML